MSVSGQLKEVFLPIIEEWWANRQKAPSLSGSDYERLGNTIADLLEMPNLPADLREAINNHLTKMFADRRILAPEWCRRLYPLLAELNKSDEANSVQQTEAAAPAPEAASEPAPVEEAAPAVEEVESETASADSVEVVAEAAEATEAVVEQTESEHHESEPHAGEYHRQINGEDHERPFHSSTF
jgi:hypothetical protein